MTVNVSSVQLRSAEFVDDRRGGARAPAGCPPHRLILEITETVLMTDVERTAALLRELKALGVRIAIDDFGTGHSSLQYLQQLPLDTLKIPKPFIDELDAEDGEGVLARAILDLGRSFDLHGGRRGDRDRAPARRGCASSAARAGRASCSPARWRRRRSPRLAGATAASCGSR